MMEGKSKRQRYDARLSELELARSGFETSWRAIGDKLIPNRMRIDQNALQGDIKDRGIYNSRPRLALRALAAMIFSGITSPTSMWFGLTLADPDLAKWKPVRQWLEHGRDVCNSLLHVSNFYKAISSGTYLDLPSICTAVLLQEEDDDLPGTMRFLDCPPGEAFLDIDAAGRVDTCFRRRMYNSRQIVAKFAKPGDKVPKVVRDAYDRCDYKTTWQVIQAIQPLAPGEPEPGLIQTGKKYTSCWWVRSIDQNEGFMRESGYQRFPVLAPRWQSMSDQAYGYGPGWDARADVGMLQHLELQKLELVGKTADPPMRERGGVKASSLLPGSVSSMPAGQDSMFEPAMQVHPASIPAVRDLIEDTTATINEVFMVHLNQLFMMDDRSDRPTATEVNAILGERAQHMGPVLESMNDEFLEPCVENVFEYAQGLGLIREAPEELEGQQVKVEFISSVHQMQQSRGLTPLMGFIQNFGMIAQLRADVIDKVDFDNITDELQRITGIRADVVLDKMEVDQIRQARAHMEQAQQQGMAMVEAAKAIRDVGSADPQNIQQNAGLFAPLMGGQAA